MNYHINLCQLDYDFRSFYIVNIAKSVQIQPKLKYLICQRVKDPSFVHRVVTNFRVKNVLAIYNSSPPSCNYDRVEPVVLSFGSFIGVNGQSERYIHMIRDFSFLVAQTYDLTASLCKL